MPYVPAPAESEDLTEEMDEAEEQAPEIAAA